MTTTSNKRVILGPPGTGKTRRLLEVARDLSKEPPLLVAYTRAAAKEMGDRCNIRGAATGTLHSACYHLLKMSPSQVINDRKLAEFGQLTGFDFTRTGTDDNPRDILALIDLATCTGRDLDEVFDHSYRPCTHADLLYFRDSYNNWKRTYGFKDYNDMLADVLAMPDPPSPRFVFVDEAQDLSPLQWRAVAHLARNAELLVVAGDDDQAIYEWSGAWPGGMAWFINEQGASAEVLNVSHRIPATVHRLAESVAGRITDRLTKDYSPREVAGSIDYRAGIEALTPDELRGSVVLYRDVTMLSQIQDKLKSSYLSYHLRGEKSRPSPYDSRFGQAWRTFHVMARGDEVEDHRMEKAGATLRHGVAFEPARLIKHRPSEVLDLPYGWSHYMDRIDLESPPEVTVSTIHKYKGAEADKIVLCTSLSERVMTEFVLNSNAEHRVFYVGVTRTRNDLMIVGGQNEYPL